MTSDGQLYGAIVKTIDSSPHIKQLLLCRCQDGASAIVQILERALVIRSIKFQVHSNIRVARILKGEAEDLVLLSLASGWLLYLRIFNEPGKSPLVVRSNKISSGSANSHCLGYDLQANSNGTRIAVLNGENTFQLVYNDVQSWIKFPVWRHVFTFKIGSQILSSCFLDPLPSPKDTIAGVDATVDSVFFLVVSVNEETEGQRISVFWLNKLDPASIKTGDLTDNSQIHASIPYLNHRDLPLLFIVPCGGRKSGVLFIYPHSIGLTSLSSILSGDPNFVIGDTVEEAFISYYKQGTLVYVASNLGNIYLIKDLSGESPPRLEYLLVARLPETVFPGEFILQPYDLDSEKAMDDVLLNSPDVSTVLVTYSGDHADGGEIITPLIPESYWSGDANDGLELEISGEEEAIYHNWAPIRDVLVIKTSKSLPRSKSKTILPSIDIFAVTGLSADTGAFCELKSGIKAELFVESDFPSAASDRLFCIEGPDNKILFIKSSPWESHIFDAMFDSEMSELRMLPDDCGFQFDAETLSIGVVIMNDTAASVSTSLPNRSISSILVAQVTSLEIVITDLRGASFRRKLGRCTRAHTLGPYILVSHYQEEGSDQRLSLFKIDGLSEIYELWSRSWLDVSLLKIIRGKDDNYKAIVGEQGGVLKKLDIWDGSSVEINYWPSTPNGDTEDNGQEDTKISPNDIVEFGEDEFLISLRNGTVVYHCESDMSINRSLKLGDVPCYFEALSGGDVMAYNGQVYYFGLRQGFRSPIPVVFDGGKRYPHISCICSLLQGGIYAAVADKQLTVWSIPGVGEPSGIVTPRIIQNKLLLGFAPIKALHLENNVKKDDPHAVVLGHKHIALVNIFDYTLWDIQYSMEGKSLGDTLFGKRERAQCMTLLKIYHENTRYNFLVIGSSDNGQGKIRFLRIKKSPSSKYQSIIEVAYIYTTPNEVTAMTWLQDNTILFCDHADGVSNVYALHIMVENHRVRVAEHQKSDALYGQIVYMTASKDEVESGKEGPSYTVYASSNKGSTNVLRMDPNSFELRVVDSTSRHVVTHIDTDDFYVASDLNQYVAGWKINELSEDPRLDLVFKCPVEGIVCRIINMAAIRPEQNRASLSLGEKAGPYLMVTLGGAIYTMVLVDKLEFSNVRKFVPEHKMPNNGIQDPGQASSLVPSKWGDKYQHALPSSTVIFADNLESRSVKPFHKEDPANIENTGTDLPIRVRSDYLQTLQVLETLSLSQV